MLETPESWAIVVARAWLPVVLEAEGWPVVEAGHSNFQVLCLLQKALLSKEISQTCNDVGARVATQEQVHAISRATGDSKTTSKVTSSFNNRWANSVNHKE